MTDKKKSFNIRSILIVLIILCSSSFSSCRSEKEWVSIFNGKDLTGWTIKIKGYPLGENFGNTMRVEDGLLKIRYDGYGPELNDRFGTVYYNRELKDY